MTLIEHNFIMKMPISLKRAAIRDASNFRASRFHSVKRPKLSVDAQPLLPLSARSSAPEGEGMSTKDDFARKGNELVTMAIELTVEKDAKENRKGLERSVECQARQNAVKVLRAVIDAVSALL